MRKIRLHRLLGLLLFIVLSTMPALSEQITNGKVTIQYEPMPDGGIKVVNVWNRGDMKIDLKLDGKPVTINANSSAQLNQHASLYVRYDYNRSAGDFLWRATATPKKEVVAEEKNPPADNVLRDSKNVREEKKAHTVNPDISRQAPVRTATISAVDYVERLNQDEFFGTEAVEAYSAKVEEFCSSIDASGNKKQFIIDADIRQFLEESEKEIREKRSNLPFLAKDLVRRSNVSPSNQKSTINLVTETMDYRLQTREDAYSKLKGKVDEIDGAQNGSSDDSGYNILNYVIVGILILVLIALAVFVVRKKRSQGGQSSRASFSTGASRNSSANSPAIVVRRKTTSILKEQSLEDVVGNPAYMMIQASEFTPNSAVDKIYIKNTCIKEIYNLYAEDLRNSENPKEDGCMVLGRWVFNEATHTYDISLEEVVFPGDDAVFKEYELNFGGKIRLRIAEKLRKLRRETNRQYDLVCWVHSHPGLGVFFSNSDENVQMQLKHAQHPNFLIAFVVDILTTDQEMGIFTFRKDGSMSSKGDLTKMYSLEELYKQALQSERNSFSSDDYFNILENARIKLPSCKGVELNNSSIIDITQIIVETEMGIVGWAIGTMVENNNEKEYAVSRIVRKGEKPGSCVVGCLISMTHLSLPSIQRLIADECGNLSFVMVYSTRLMTLTTIPIVNGELVPDEQFYGDVNIDELKIWTRRKR